MTSDYTLIEEDHQLGPLLEAVAEQSSVAIDTEADSLHHYREKLCLLQLSAGDRQWIVDPLSPRLDARPLLELLAARELLLHGADYDLRLMYRAYEFRPARVFDTMFAAQLLGWPQIGLAASVERVIGIEMSKHGQRADWSVRPLSDKLLCYAADDTRYLSQLAERQRHDLDELGRLGWHQEACERVIGQAACEATVERRTDWRIKGGRQLRGRSAAMLRELWQWREDTASRLDRPPFKVMNSEYLLEWANWVALNPGRPAAEGPPLPKGLRGSRLESFERAIERALAMPAAQWPGQPVAIHDRSGSRRVPEELLRRALTVRDELARELGLDPGVVAPRDAVRDLLCQHLEGRTGSRIPSSLMRWQHALLVPVLAPVLEGATSAAASEAAPPCAPPLGSE